MKKLLCALLCATLVLSLAVSAIGEVAYSQGADEHVVRVGNSEATSGGLAVVGVPMNAGIEAYFKMVNEAGGIDGRTIAFWHTDDEFDPAKGKAALEEMVEDEKLFAIVGAMGTPVVAAIIDDMKDYGIPCVYFATGIPQLFTTGAVTNEEGYNIFPVQPLYETEGRILTAYATGKFGAKKIGVIIPMTTPASLCTRALKPKSMSLRALSWSRSRSPPARPTLRPRSRY